MTKAQAKARTHEGDSCLESILVDSYCELRRFAAVVGPLELPPDDLVHDAIVAGLSRRSYVGVSDPVAYTKRTILNMASNERRRLGRRRSALRLLDGGRRNDESDVYPSDLEYLNELGPDARAVLFMHYVEGEPFEQIARELGKQASTVRQIATRARRRLREMGAEL
ncbi:MAG: sigma-70 family RNA polymerase sigma factor [Actinomycetota bacterium]